MFNIDNKDDIDNKLRYMASISMLVSEIAHAIGRPNNRALREDIRLLVIQTRNECIRRSYENHGYIDKFLTQRFKVSLTDVYDGEIELPEDIDVDVTKVKRTKQKVPRPVRLTNNLPFDRVSSAGFKTNKVYPYIKETTARFRQAVPGLCGMVCYDYINEYIYLFPTCNKPIEVGSIVIESAFEHPNEIHLINKDVNEDDIFMDENEWLLSEDMIGQIKDIMYKRDLLDQYKENDEIPDVVKFK